MMQNLVINNHKTIVCTIHQPNRQIFEIFQQIVLLSDGHIVFNGSSADTITFFKGQGYKYNDEQNPAEYFISSITDKRRKENEKNCQSFLHDDYLKSEYFQNIRKYVNNPIEQHNSMLSRILIYNVLYTIIIYFTADVDLDTSFFTVIMSSIVLILLVFASSARNQYIFCPNQCIEVTLISLCSHANLTLPGIAISIFSQNVTLVNTYSYPVIQCSLVCNGLFIKLSSLPFFLSWIQYVSIEKSAFSAIYNIYFKDMHHIRDKGEKADDNINGISVIWKNLSVIAEDTKDSIFRKTQKSYKRVIHNVTGAIFPNNLVAVLGASGSGKTTLLSALANRTAGGLQIRGDIRIDGKSSKEFLKQVSGYVYQDDFFIPELTVMQHLNFTAKLRLDRNIKEGDRKQMILKVLREVGLLELANVSIGDSNYEGKMTLSGGERKRLSVATELLTGSQLLFCDEPTTGLDSYSSYKLMSIMQNMVIESNRTIVCAIHQPNMQIFQLFKQIILLSDGHIVFNGSTANAIQFFQGQGYRYNFEQNPAEYFISSIAIKREKENERSSESTLHGDYLKSEYFESVQNYVNNGMEQPDVAKCTPNLANSPTWFSKLIIFIHRNFLTMMKLSSCHTIRLSVTILLATFIGLFLYGTVEKTQFGIKAIKTGIYFIIVGNFFTPLTVTLSHIPNQMPLFYREYSNNSTTPCIFYLSNILALLPNFLLEPLCWSLIISLLTGLYTTCYTLMITLTVSILLFNGSAVLGIILSMLCSNSSIAATYGDDIMYVFYTSSGLLLKLSSIPYCLQWIQYISTVTYATSALFVVQFENLYDIECETNSNVPCFRTGLEVLKSFDFDKDSLYNDIIVMLLLYFVFHIIAYLCFLHRIKNRIM